MRKKILLVFLISILLIFGLLFLTGCGNKGETIAKDGKTYNIHGLSIKLDKDEEYDKIKYLTSSFFERKFKVTGTSYTIYKDDSKDKYDLSNITFRLDVSTDIMNTNSTIEKEKALVKNKDTYKNIEQSQKNINDIIWDYFVYDNNNGDISFKQHLYITERKVDNYYYLYKIYFSFAEDIDEFEEAFMNNIKFE